MSRVWITFPILFGTQDFHSHAEWEWQLIQFLWCITLCLGFVKGIVQGDNEVLLEFLRLTRLAKTWRNLSLLQEDWIQNDGDMNAATIVPTASEGEYFLFFSYSIDAWPGLKVMYTTWGGYGRDYLIAWCTSLESLFYWFCQKWTPFTKSAFLKVKSWLFWSSMPEFICAKDAAVMMIAQRAYSSSIS